MAAPNIIVASTMYGKTAGQVIGITPTAIVSNAAGSGTVVKVNALMVANVNTAANYSITVDVFNGSVAYRLAYQIVVPANSSIDILVKSVYLEEGWSIRLSGSVANNLEAVASYEVVA